MKKMVLILFFMTALRAIAQDSGQVKGSFLFKPAKTRVPDVNVYRVSRVSSITWKDQTAWTGGMSYNNDEGSFVLSLDKSKPEVTKIENKFENLKTVNCNRILLNPGWNSGLIHIVGPKFIKVTPGTPDNPEATVEIVFIKTPISLSIFHFDCLPPQNTKRRSNGAIAPPVAFSAAPAYPQYINSLSKMKAADSADW